MELAEILNKVEGEPVEIIFRGKERPLVEGWVYHLTHFKNTNLELLLPKGNTGKKSGGDTEGKSIQTLTHLGIHPKCNHQRSAD